MLVNLQGHGDDVDLLDDDGWFVVGHEQVPSAAGAGVQEVVRGDRGEHLGREQLALVCGMSRLAAGLASLLAGRRLRLGRLTMSEEGAGRVRGILAGRGELFLQLLDGGLKSGELGARRRLRLATAGNWHRGIVWFSWWRVIRLCSDSTCDRPSADQASCHNN